MYSLPWVVDETDGDDRGWDERGETLGVGRKDIL